jgi:hypothetical protein
MWFGLDGVRSWTRVEVPYWKEGIKTQGEIIQTLQPVFAHSGQRKVLAAAILFAHGAGGGARPKGGLLYEFHDEAGNRHVGNALVAVELWRQFKKGGPITVEYLRDDPAVNRPLGTGRPLPWFHLGILLFSVYCLLASLVFEIPRKLAQSWRYVRLIETGFPAIGLVDRVLPALKRVPQRVAYRYLTSLNGRTGEVRNGLSEIIGKQAKSWKADERILVLIDPLERDQHAIDWFGVRSDELTTLLQRTSDWPPQPD